MLEGGCLEVVGVEAKVWIEIVGKLTTLSCV
jgi:hypothetical protein